MRNKFLIALFILLATAGLHAQTGDVKPIRITDSLSAQEKINRHTVLLRSELDSLIKQYNLNQQPIIIKEVPKDANNDNSIYLFALLGGVLLLCSCLLYLFYTHQKKFNKAMAGLKLKTQYSDPIFNSTDMSKVKLSEKPQSTNGKKMTPQALERKISDMNAEMTKLTKENESLNRVIKEYNGIQHEFDALKHGISKAYKVKNYPGYDKNKEDISALQAVLDTENAVATYAYEKFLKPILAITDDNKNNPAKINEEDREKLLELLISLSLLYIEYLYLRVNDLAIGGKMVERIEALSKGNGLDSSLLKKLNTEHGSRALVLRMILDKTTKQRLSYPVFDETNLNQ